MKERILTCIVCPRGCTLKVLFDKEGGISDISGNACKRGLTYAEDECTHPKRTVTSTVRLADGRITAVKTTGAVPKESVFEVMKAINALCPEGEVSIGDILLRDVLGTGVDIVVTGNATR